MDAWSQTQVLDAGQRAMRNVIFPLAFCACKLGAEILNLSGGNTQRRSEVLEALSLQSTLCLGWHRYHLGLKGPRLAELCGRCIPSNNTNQVRTSADVFPVVFVATVLSFLTE